MAPVTYDVHYINLDKRVDRKEQIEEQFKSSTLFKLRRFSAVLKEDDGAIGCTFSHLKLLKKAIDENMEYIIIIEDDFVATNMKLLERKVSKTIRLASDFDVLLLGGNIVPPYTKNSNDTIQVTHSQTTVGYMVKKHYFQRLYDNIKQGLYYLMKMPEQRVKYAIDKFWIQLQKKDKWIMIFPLMVYQRESYSDIEKRNTDYKSLMLDANKTEWLNAQK